MKHVYLVLSAIFATGSVLAAPSSAVLVETNGSVLVNQGKQFVSAKPGQLLTVGDRVMVMDGSNASVRFADGCMLPLAAGSLVTVSAQSTCVAGKANIAQISPVSAQAAGDRDADCDGDKILDSLDPDIDGDDVLNAQDNQNVCQNKAGWANSTGTWAAIAVVGVGVVVLNDDDDKTVSP